MPIAERAGIAVHWQEYGAGARPVLALHCSLARGSAWSGVAARLGADVTVTAPDLPGHGQSGDWDGAGDFVRLCTQVAGAMISRPVDLVGHSLGGVAALRLALAAPEAVRTLTLIEPVLFAAARGSPEYPACRDEAARNFAPMATGDREAAARNFTTSWGDGTDWDAIPDRLRRYMADRIHLIPATDAALFDDAGGLLDEGRLEALDLPVMIIAGAASPPVIPRIAEAIAARLPDVGVAEAPGAGHMAPITHPDEVAGLIRVNMDRG